MTWKAMLDKSGAYSKHSAKAELNLQLNVALQLHAVRPAGSLQLCVPNIHPSMKYPNLQAIKQ